MNLKHFAGALVATTIAGSAFAADLPARKEAPAYLAPAPVMTWTGFYIGLNAGYTWSNNTTSVASIPVFQNPGLTPFGLSQLNNITFGGTGTLGSKRNGFIGGGQIGWNWQSGAFLAGIETDIQGIASGGGGSTLGSFLPTTIAGTNTLSSITTTSKLNWLGTLRGRVGYLVTPAALLYATGGLAYGGVKSTATSFYSIPGAAPAIFGFGTATSSNTRVGWTIGAGGEWMFSPNWSAKIEYLYYDLGSFTYINPITQNQPGGVGFVASDVSQIRVRNNGHIVRAGVNYRFNWGGAGPVVARY